MYHKAIETYNTVRELTSHAPYLSLLAETDLDVERSLLKSERFLLFKAFALVKSYIISGNMLNTRYFVWIWGFSFRF